MSSNPRLDSATGGPKGPTTRAVVRSYLELPDLGALKPAPAGAREARLERITPCSASEWRALYRQIGAPWHWHDRDSWTDHQLANRLASPHVAIFAVALRAPDGHWERPRGFLELERHAHGEVEIVYLGLDTTVLGLGIGGWLVTEAARTAAAMGNGRVILNTCTLDAPAAMPNYLARGFTVTRTETYTVGSTPPA